MTIPRAKPDDRWLLVLALYLSCALWGVAEAVTHNQLCDFVGTMLIASTAALWTVFDARRLNRPILHIVQLFLLMFWPIAVPLYLIWSRGIRGVGWAVLHAIGLYLAVCIGPIATVIYDGFRLR